MRLNKYLSESGACSRREADSYITEGRVTVNGVPAALGTQVAEGDEVKLDGDIVGEARKRSRPVYIALNKPVGITCTTERHVAGNIVDFVDHPERVFPIGRLDKDSEGLILLTNDGDIVNEVLRAEHRHEKEYVVAVDRAITSEFLADMAAGVRLSDATTLPCKVTRLAPKVFRIVLTQGLNRQIRRMCEAFGYVVEALQRVRIMRIHLGELPLGRWRNLTHEEIQTLLPRHPQAGPGGEASPGSRPQGGPHASSPAPGGSRTSPGGSRTSPGGSRTSPGGSRTSPGGSRTSPGGPHLGQPREPGPRFDRSAGPRGRSGGGQRSGGGPRPGGAGPRGGGRHAGRGRGGR